MPYQPAGSNTGGETPPAADYSHLSIDQLEEILKTPPKGVKDVAESWHHLALDLSTKIMGTTAANNSGMDPFANGMPSNPRDALAKLRYAEPDSFDAMLYQLRNWQGKAADEFIGKALEVRAYGVSIAQCFYRLSEDYGGTWTGYTFHDTLGSMASDLNDFEGVWSDPATGLRIGRGQIAQNLWDWLAGQVGSTNNNYSFNDGTMLTSTIQSDYTTFDYQPLKYFVNVPYRLHGVVDWTNYKVQLTNFDDYGKLNETRDYDLGYLTTVRVGQDEIMNFYANDYQRQLRDLLSAFAVTYVVAKTQLPVAPTPPKGLGQNSSSTTTPTYGPGSYGGGSPYGNLSGVGAGSNGNVPGYGTGGASGGSYNPGTGVVGTSHPGIPNAGGYNPGSYNPGQYPGGSGGPGSPNAGGWNPTQLAGYNPNLGGGGLAPGSTGFAGGGPGTQSGGGLGSAGGGALAGAGGAGGAIPGGGSGGTAGGSGAAGRAMPMAPMGGAGGGKEGKERQRAAWLSEDEDVWGVDDDGGDAVL